MYRQIYKMKFIKNLTIAMQCLCFPPKKCQKSNDVGTRKKSHRFNIKNKKIEEKCSKRHVPIIKFLDGVPIDAKCSQVSGVERSNTKILVQVRIHTEYKFSLTGPYTGIIKKQEMRLLISFPPKTALRSYFFRLQ